MLIQHLLQQKLVNRNFVSGDHWWEYKAELHLYLQPAVELSSSWSSVFYTDCRTEGTCF